jgi:hypothetical protein
VAMMSVCDHIYLRFRLGARRRLGAERGSGGGDRVQRLCERCEAASWLRLGFRVCGGDGGEELRCHLFL